MTTIEERRYNYLNVQDDVIIKYAYNIYVFYDL